MALSDPAHTPTLLLLAKDLCTFAGHPRRTSQEHIGIVLLENPRFRPLTQRYSVDAGQLLIHFTVPRSSTTHVSSHGGEEETMELVVTPQQLCAADATSKRLFQLHRAFVKVCIGLGTGGHYNNQKRIGAMMPLEAISLLLSDPAHHLTLNKLKVCWDAVSGGGQEWWC